MLAPRKLATTPMVTTTNHCAGVVRGLKVTEWRDLRASDSSRQQEKADGGASAVVSGGQSPNTTGEPVRRCRNEPPDFRHPARLRPRLCAQRNEERDSRPHAHGG